MATDDSPVTLLIDGYEFEGFDDIEITFGLDSYSDISFSTPFESENADFRRLFRPFSFLPVQVLQDLEFLFTGTMLTPVPEIDVNRKIVQIVALSLPAVLGDCNPPGDSMPVQFEKANLKTISDELVKPFGIKTKFEGDPGAPFAKAKVDIEETIDAFLSNLARQRGFVKNSTPEGELRYWKTVNPGSPVETFEQGIPPLTRVVPEYKPQDYFTEITGYAKATKRRPGGKETVKNPHLSTPLRSKSFKFDDTERGDEADDATRGAMGRMFGNIASWKIEDLPTWFDSKGRLYQPNTTLMVKAPDAMIYSPYEFVIRSVTLKKTANVRTASLEIVLPGAFSGEVPETLPWD